MDDVLTQWGAQPAAVDLLRVLTRRQTQELLGLSEKTWERLDAVGDTPIKTRLSPGRVGYRLDHIKQWLDVHQVSSAAEPQHRDTENGLQ
jgi:predicted DNA-binding transcriptional regulator AlpA